MNFTSWEAPVRRLPPAEVREFYDAELADIHAFLFETSQLELPQHRGCLSLKLILSGEERYVIGRRAVSVRAGQVLFLNSGETYGSQIRTRTRSLAVFFPDAEAIEAGGGRQLELPQAAFQASAHFARLLDGFLRALAQGEDTLADESARRLLLAALTDLRRKAPRSGLPRVRKRTTRHELIGRVIRAREYVDDMRGANCTLDRLAEIACLSKYHFLRVFTEVTGVGPASYARSVRKQVRSREFSNFL